MPADKWFITQFSDLACKEAYYAYLYTDVPCHLWLRWTTSRPRKHKKAVTFRGLTTMSDVYFCVTSFHEVEQEEAGDTLIHTFVVSPMKADRKFYFYFHGQINGENAPSTSPVYGRQLFFTSHDLSVTITHEDDVAIAWMGLILSNPPSAPAFCYTGNSAGPGRPEGGALRFRAVNLPRCAEIAAATLYLMAWGFTDKEPILSQLSVEDNIAPPDFYDVSDAEFWARWSTRQHVTNWDNIPPWVNETWYTAPDITALIEHVVNHPNWQRGNPIVIFWDDFLQRTPFGAAMYRICRLYAEGLPGIPVLNIAYYYWQVRKILPW